MPTHDEYCSRETARHVAYELAMFDHLYKRLVSLSAECNLYDPDNIQFAGTGWSSEDKMDASSFLESFLLHSRVLLDFFFYGEKREKDNVLAGDFIDDWGVRSRSECKYLYANWERLNKSLAHLAQRRVDYNHTDKEWNIEAVHLEIASLIAEFMARLTPKQKSWFE